MAQFKDISGKRFGKLTVKKQSTTRKGGLITWKCVCECGKETHVITHYLNAGKIKSCGCAKGAMISEAKTKHGMCYTPFYSVWNGMNTRCKDVNNKHYGAKGIEVCARWKRFSNFMEDMFDGYEEGLTIDRVDSCGNYEPLNCRWVTQAINNRNKNNNLTYKGECASEASRRLGGRDEMVSQRIRSGWGKEKAFTTPSMLQ